MGEGGGGGAGFIRSGIFSKLIGGEIIADLGVFTECAQGVVEAALDGPGGDVHRGGDFVEGEAVNKTEQDAFALRFGEGAEHVGEGVAGGFRIGHPDRRRLRSGLV